MRFTKLTLAATTALMIGTVAFTTPAFAGNDDEGGGGCKESCGTPAPSTTYNQGGDGGTGIGVGIGVGVGIGGEGGKGGQGGQGGKGGDGGNAIQGQQQGQQQGQLQGQLQGQHQSSNNTNHNSNHNSNENTNFNANVNLNHNANSNSNSNTNTNNLDNSNSNNASQSVDIHNERAPVSTAYSAPLVSGEDTCMGSSSIGGQAVGFGLTLGTTWTDTNCQRLKNSRQLASLGFSRAAVALVCADEAVQDAMQAAGTPCPVAQHRAEATPARAESNDRSAERSDADTHRVARNTFADTDAPAAAPVVAVVPAAPVHHYVPMQPIKD